MKGLDNNTLFLSKSSPIKFFCTNIEWKKINVLVNDKRDIDLIEFLIKNNIFKTENNIFKNISKSKKETFKIIFWNSASSVSFLSPGHFMKIGVPLHSLRSMGVI